MENTSVSSVTPSEECPSIGDILKKPTRDLHSYERPELYVKFPLHCDCQHHAHLARTQRVLASFIVTDFNLLSSPRNDTCREKCRVELEECPRECTSCWREPWGNFFFIDCAYRNLSQLPIFTPNHFERTVWNLTGNQFTKLPTRAEMSHFRMVQLLLGHNKISQIDLKNISLE